MNIFFVLVIVGFLYFIAHQVSYRVYGFSLLTFSQTTNVSIIAKKEIRVAALTKAKEFLGPYSDIWGSFTLANRFCTVKFDANKMKIHCKSKIYDPSGRKHYFTAEKFDMISIDDYWNSLCNMFTMQTNYQQVFNSCKTIAYLSNVDYIENKDKAYSPQSSEENFSSSYNVKSAYTFKEFYPNLKNVNNENQVHRVDTDSIFLDDNEDDLLDINNASEAEITELPGINIVIAKKIVKERTENGAFKNKQDFFERINIKSHFAQKIEGLICIKEIKVINKQRKNTERIVDFE